MKRKTSNADLEGKRSIFFQIGLAIALLIAVLVVNYKQTKPSADTITVKVTGLNVRSAADVDSTSVARPPEVSR
ncbi:MAG: hypothetical protein IIT37_03760 [Bacteroidales bacterium]|jgi:uncharacterized Tic20 family protein|nr:hypothetical protein [Bacteroidales bacterium]MBQ5575144.1 hypothetical protein [Bacteroidales bacterium]